MKNTSTRIKGTAVLDLIEEAQNAELCRNLELSQSIFAPVWSDIAEDPDLSQFDPVIRAAFSRLCGFFLSYYGHCKGRMDFQIRGKDLLTQAIDLFDKEDLPERSAEAQVMLALCYWYSGEIEEADAILRSIEQTFKGNELHPVYLQIKVNKLMIMFWKGEFQPGVEIIEQITTPIEFCRDSRLKAMFHNQAGILFNVLSRYESAIVHLNEAIRFARIANNKRFVVSTLNNLAFSNKQLGRFDDAHEVLDRAQQINAEMSDIGWQPHIVDTRALIYLDQGRPADALAATEQAVEMFRQGEDHAGLVDSTWTKCRCLIRLDRLSEALVEFAGLMNIASARIGGSAVEKYTELFASEVYCIRDRSLSESVSGFKKFMILRAMRQANGGIVEASKLLGLKNHQALSEMLNKQFPEIFSELGLRRRSRRQDAKTSKPQVKRPVMRDISRIRPSRSAASRAYETFYFSSHVMNRFAIDEESIVAVARTDKLEAGLDLLYCLNNEFAVGKLQQDKFSGLFYIAADGREVLVDEMQVIGTPVGYCPLAKADTDEPEFTPLGN